MADKLSAYEELSVPQTPLGELYYGPFKSARSEENLAQIERFLVAADIFGVDNETARQYGKSAAQLARDGTPIPQNDIWIAAVAVQCGLPLATTDGHFQRVEGLNVVLRRLVEQPEELGPVAMEVGGQKKSHAICAISQTSV